MAINLRPYIRKAVLEVLKWTEENAPAIPVQRGGAQALWKREIRIPNPVIAGVSLLIIFFVMSFQLGFSATRFLGIGMFLMTSFFFLWTYLRLDRPALLKDSESMALLGILMVTAVLIIAVFNEAQLYGYPVNLATPLAAFSLLTAFLLSKRLAIVLSVALCLIFAILNDFTLKYFYAQLLGCISCAWMVPAVRNRSDINELGFKIAGLNVVSIFTAWCLSEWSGNTLRTLVIDMTAVAASGIFSAVIVLTTLHSLEKFFSRTTNIKLLELADFNTPLLKRLMVEAPGTYHHSLIVASLAEQAAEAIGANPLLARVGAYYHDIGKLVKSEYFIENQQSIGNPHDPLTPTMSSLVVISHVKEGVAFAKEQDLDKIIIDCIEQHHGTSLIHYFYHRALEKNTEIEQENFRYPGPKPKIKETAILMLADAAEAACRALDEATPGRIQDTVEKLINNKFTDGQFSECPITLHDLSSIAESLVSTLNGIYHVRVEYKDTEVKKDD
jgi:putative nucleotidyltransferase with HDIG domain